MFPALCAVLSLNFCSKGWFPESQTCIGVFGIRLPKIRANCLRKQAFVTSSSLKPTLYFSETGADKHFC